MSLNSWLAALPNPMLPMLNALRPGMAWAPGMPTLALAFPIPAQSVLRVWNFTLVKPRSSSLMACWLRVWVQPRAAPTKGASLVPVRLLGIGARSGSDLNFWRDKRANMRSALERFASILKSPWWALCLSEFGATRLFVTPGNVGEG